MVQLLKRRIDFLVGTVNTVQDLDDEKVKF
jgi:hypothetical protein